jgi:uncharacterized protein YpmB
MDRKRRNLIIIVSGVLLIAAVTVAVIYYVRSTINQKNAELAEMADAMNFEKEQVEKEFKDMNTEFDGYTSNIHNDSLVKLLDDQKTKVQQLLDELRVTKSTNARRIAQLKQELATVRKVMIQYVNQIDSLNAMNHVLKTENVEVKRKYQNETEKVQQLSKEKADLHQVVTRASILEVTNFSMTPLNSKGKKTSWFTQTANLQFNYTIAKNVTAQPGEKTIYLRITRPDDDVLTKSPNNVFPYENKNIAYSASKKFEYNGDALSDVIYWKVGEILPKGTYRAEFFADGNRIGSFTFLFEK